MQNQIHELAKTLPPPRKQNTACDACRSARFLSICFNLAVQLLCRSRKVKCHRLPGHDKVCFTSCLTSHPLNLFLATVSGTSLFRYPCLLYIFNHYDSTVYPKTTLARAFPFALPVVVTHSPIHQAFCSASYK